MSAVPSYAPEAAVDLDCAAAIELGRRWVDASNRRDAETLVEIADPNIVFHPTRLFDNRGPYSGHDGLREWIADVREADLPLTERVTDVRRGHGGDMVVLGHVLLRGRRTSPFSIVMSVRDSKIAEAHVYLSDEAELERIGRIAG